MQEGTQTTAPTLQALHDVVVPEQVSWMPATDAWYMLFGVAAVAAIALVIVSVRRYRANRYRREALARLDDIEATLADGSHRAAALSTLPTITKQVALVFCPRADIAELSGEPWLEYLDTTYEGDAFCNGAGRLLPRLAYASPASLDGVSDTQVAALTTLLRAWIKGHHVRV